MNFPRSLNGARGKAEGKFLKRKIMNIYLLEIKERWI
jgi:hypothetical protein